jgi:fluoroacetyl-CoA thioesterase
MISALSTGLTHVQSLDIHDKPIVSAVSRDGSGAMPPAFSTAFVVGLIEWACIETLRPFLEEGEQTVGNHIYVSHVAPAAVSVKVTAIVELVEVRGQTLRFRIDCFDECDQIGTGFHERTVLAMAPAPKGASASGIWSHVQ